ncbi:MAG: hypothetical protein GF320_07895 [Armatimonadia bacterium]|nr:hypothetical protein [Armatimonadia bacterium]
MTGRLLLALFILLLGFSLVQSGCVTSAPSAEPGSISARFETSIHNTRQGKRTWYAAENGGFEALTGVPLSSMPCLDCHAHPPEGEPDTWDGPGCDNCHKEEGQPPTQQTCLGCHQRQGLEIKLATGGNQAFSDVHRSNGMVCIDCHTAAELHGDGSTPQTMFDTDPGPSGDKCLRCHNGSRAPAPSPVGNAHGIHLDRVDCSACHVQSAVSCYNCHLEDQLESPPAKTFYKPVLDWALLINYRGKVHLANLQSVEYQDKTFVAMGPYYGHTVSRRGRNCEECHSTDAMAEYKSTGKIQMAEWDASQQDVTFHNGVVPVPPDWDQGTLAFDFVTKDADNLWSFLEAGPDAYQMLYGEPLTSEQIATLGGG